MSKNNIQKPLFIHLPKDIVAKKCKVVKYMDFDKINSLEADQVKFLQAELSDYETDSSIDYEDPEAILFKNSKSCDSDGLGAPTAKEVILLDSKLPK